MIVPVTFYNDRINNEIVEYQKKVFDYFSLDLNQIHCKDWPGHGHLVDRHINSLGENWEYFVLFDIDCIPLDKDIINEGINWSKNNLGLFSVAQRHYKKSEVVYASPAFLVFSKKTYDLLGKPTFVETERSDVAGELTHKCIEMNLDLNIIYPTSVEQERWILTGNKKFGVGTNYGNRIYHAFESRFDNSKIFVNKCKEVLNEK